MTKKQYLWLSIALMVIGIAFLVWGGFVYRGYEGMKEARVIMRHATWHALLQYGAGLVCLIAGYVFVKKTI